MPTGGPMPGEVNERTVAAYRRAVGAALAALDAPAGDEARAAALAVEDVDDVAELRRVVGALAWLCVGVVPGQSRRRVPVRRTLEELQLEVTWRAS
jgi:hypothetical protein